ncbi:MAG: class II aldolase/adducin family protein [Proteobacteria bacterium]|nr:class II aldolase/adducin family protein [Pseudomonadota bacterium]
MLNEQSLRMAMISVAKRLYEKNLLAAADGNISYRIDDQKILITPAGCSKALLSSDDMAVITIDGEIISGNPSTERLMHLTVYNYCPEARCVVHAHPPTAIAWSIAYPELTELPAESMSELILSAGQIPFVPYARPGTQTMGEVLIPFLPEHRLMVLSRHGALAWGEDLEEAANGIERLEHSADILMKAQLLCGITKLPQKEIDVLREMRQKIGKKLL